MKREIIETADGSKTIHIPEWNENYHSHHGAKQEAEHVFIQAGLRQFETHDSILILEIGFGTGLNAWLTAIANEEKKRHIHYQGIEAFPVDSDEMIALNYAQLFPEHENIYSKIYQSNWNQEIAISPFFSLTKWKTTLQHFQTSPASIDLIYFDAFGPRVQEELWETTIFRKLFDFLKPTGCLVTYCAKGQVKRNMKEAGFEIEALPGPPGKREMTRAWKR